MWNLPGWNYPLHPVMIGAIGHVLLVTVGYAASWFFPAPDPGSRAMTLWGWRDRLRAPAANAR
jgi:hypothetical protein